MVKNAKIILSFVCVVILMGSLNVCAFASYNDDINQPKISTGRWHFEKSSELPPDLYDEFAKPISAFITGPGSITTTYSESISYSLNIEAPAGLIDIIKAKCNTTVTKSTSTTIGYTLQEQKGETVRMWYTPSMVKVRGRAQLIATPGGILRQENIVAYLPQSADTHGHYYLSPN